MVSPGRGGPTARVGELTVRGFRPGTDRARARAFVGERIAARYGQIPSARACYGSLSAMAAVRRDASIVVVHPDKAGTQRTGTGRPLIGQMAGEAAR
ncbi:MAG: hypothetical protein QG608_1718 [Actinomycetota bacterium]|nr:hypothetical protein [Actinomycetota bacterium]